MTLLGRVAPLMAIVLCATLVSSVLVLPEGALDEPAVEASSSLTEVTEERSVSYRWYDFFGMPYGEWWDYREEYYGLDFALTDSFPYLNRHYYEYNGTAFDTFSSARLNITGRDMPELNMSERPVFLPFLSGPGGPRGGNATIDWHMRYLTIQDYIDRGYPTPTMPFDSWFDGYVILLEGTARFDRDASMSVMDLTPEAFGDFDTWWVENENAFIMDYVDWLVDEGDDRLDIFCMYDYQFLPLVFWMSAEKVGDEIVLGYDFLSWGMEALMTRWLRDAFMPTEWWFEDFTMHAEIRADSADLDIDTAVPFAVKAWETKESGAPCWTWQGMLGDHIPSLSGHHSSDFDPYSDLSHVSHSPGSSTNGLMVPYEYTPGCFNLSEGETLSFTWPESDILFLEHVEPGVTNNVTGPTIIGYSEPLATEMEGDSDYSPATRVLTFSGPVDFWTWSQNQEEHEYLSAEWDRIAILPWGMPYLEMSYWGPDAPPLAYIEAERTPDATTAAQYFFNASLSCDSEDALEALQFRWDFDGDDSWDTDWAYESTVEHDLGVEGVFEARVEVKDSDGMTDVSSVKITITDLDPPVTAVSVAGEEGEGGWYVSAVAVSLSAIDDAGIEATFYQLDEGAWKEYGGPFGVSSDGLHKVEFYSVDGECNHEDVQQTRVKIDSTAPTVTFVTIESVYTTDEVTVFWVCSDVISGLQQCTIALDGGVPESAGSEMSYTFTDLDDGTHTARLVVYDNAGNSATAQYFFTVETPAEKQGEVWVYVIVAGTVGAVAVAAAILLLRRRKG